MGIAHPLTKWQTTRAMTPRPLTLTTPERTLPGNDALRQLLERDERDHRWLASKTTFSASHIWRVIHEGRRISETLADQLAAIFGVPATTFLDPEATDGR